LAARTPVKGNPGVDPLRAITYRDLHNPAARPGEAAQEHVDALHVAAEDLAGTRSVAADALVTRIPNASTNTRVWVPICFLSVSLSDVLRRSPIYPV
jgi:hypothetical protein